MAEPVRRYTEEQKQRILQSGEKPPENMGIVGRTARNVLAAIPRVPTDMLAFVGMVKPLLDTAVMNVGSTIGLTEDTDLATELYGEEGMKPFTEYVQRNVDAELARLPEERRTQANVEALATHFSNSEEARNMLLEAGPTLTKWGMKGSNAINDMLGLNRVEDETIVDDVTQIGAQSLVTLGAGAVPGLATRAATTTAGKLAMSAAELALPFSRGGAANIAANTGAQIALSQGARALSDQPSVFTGDALGPEYGITPAYDADADPDSGMNGEQLAAAGAGVGGMALAAAVLAGKANRGVAKQAIDAVEAPEPAAPKGIDPEAELERSLTGAQRTKSEFVDSSAPLRDTVRNAGGSKSAVADIEHTVTDAADVNIRAAHTNAMELGLLPGLDRRTIPAAKLFEAVRSLDPADAELFNNGMIAKTMLDQHALRIKSLEDELRDAKMGIATGDTGQQKRKYAIEKQIESEKADSAQLTDTLTVKQARELAAALKANPKLSEIEARYRQINSDIIESDLRLGHYDQQTADRLRASHPNYMMLQEDPEAGMSFIPKWWNRTKEMMKGTEQPKLFGSARGPLMERAGNDVKVQNPLNAMQALRQRLHDHIEYAKHNAATKTYVEAMRKTPDWGRTIREVESMPLAEFNARGKTSKTAERNDLAAYTADGKIHFIEVADPEVLRALQFNAPAVAGLGMNLMRRWYQHGTTGLFSPEFAPTAALFEDNIARMTRQPGRSYGIFDATLRRAFPNSTALSSVLDKLGGTPVPFMNTSQLQMLAGVFQQIRYSSLHAAGQKIADALENNSALIRSIGAMPGSRAIVEGVGQAMLRSYNESRYATFVNSGITHSNLLDDPLKKVRPGYEAANFAMKKASVPVRAAFRTYMNMLEMVHNSSKYAFFAQNYAALQRKHGGVVPKGQLDKLIGEVRSLSGDMTRSVGNQFFSKTLSTIPYGQIAINSTYHLASAIKNDPVNVGARVLSGHVIPKIAAIGLISSIPAMSDWYWNDLPAWQRFSKFPVIGPDWWIDVANGNQRPITPNDVYLMPEAPEMTFLTNPVITALRGFGAFGEDQAARTAYGKELAEGMDGVIGVATPPLIGALAAGTKVDLGNVMTWPLTGKPVVEEAYNESAHQGMNAGGINADSMFSRTFQNMLTSLFGIAVGNVVNSMDIVDQSIDDGQTFGEALSKALQFETYHRERRLPEVPGTRETGAFLYTDGQRRRYALSQRRERVNEAMAMYEPLRMQLSADNDKSGANAWAVEQGMDPLKSIADPQMRQVADVIHTMLGKGKMKNLVNTRSELNKRLARVEANRENLNPREYHNMSNDIQREMAAVNKDQEDIIDDLEGLLFTKYGVTLKDSIGAIEASLAR